MTPQPASESSFGAINAPRLDSSSGLPVDIMVTISQLPKIIYDLTSQGLMAEEMIKDVGQMIVERSFSIYSRGPRAMDWEDFHDYTTVSDTPCYPSAMHLIMRHLHDN
ncbi:hypothetical protein E2C01_015866 [Portunus trituberculatus]|uniref:Carboxypeptidase activation peptide domain-containing protein n=1 Tax=Portunus trituberculatus TaxID=210409 RepID=A0A5B7DP35_PORTR|nr:hypothetical protein [Portunus trituberculatus]